VLEVHLAKGDVYSFSVAAKGPNNLLVMNLTLRDPSGHEMNTDAHVKHLAGGKRITVGPFRAAASGTYTIELLGDSSREGDYYGKSKLVGSRKTRFTLPSDGTVVYVPVAAVLLVVPAEDQVEVLAPVDGAAGCRRRAVRRERSARRVAPGRTSGQLRERRIPVRVAERPRPRNHRSLEAALELRHGRVPAAARRPVAPRALRVAPRVEAAAAGRAGPVDAGDDAVGRHREGDPRRQRLGDAHHAADALRQLGLRRSDQRDRRRPGSDRDAAGRSRRLRSVGADSPGPACGVSRLPRPRPSRRPRRRLPSRLRSRRGSRRSTVTRLCRRSAARRASDARPTCSTPRRERRSGATRRGRRLPSAIRRRSTATSCRSPTRASRRPRPSAATTRIRSSGARSRTRRSSGSTRSATTRDRRP